jgi:hypothetical protein
VDKALAGHGDTPTEHEDGHPDGGTETLEEDVGGDLEECVRDEEDGETDIVLRFCDVDVLCHSIELKSS